MSEPRFGSDRVAQAVYAWSQVLIDGSKGMGFSAISPSLSGSVDWLSHLHLPEFNLFAPHSIQPVFSYEERHGFSEVGRAVKGNIGIIYRKTADGVVDPTSRRHPVVHALFSDATTLGLLCLNRIPEHFWIRHAASSAGGGLNLQDVAISDIYSTRGSVTKHICPRDHSAALNLLRSVVECRIERDGRIGLRYGRNTLESIALAFPLDVADNFLLCSYLDDTVIRRELHLQAYDMAGLRTGSFSVGLASDSGSCQLRRAVMSAAKKFLYVDEPSFRRYANAVLDLSISNSQRV
jgi:hypothetical protein